MKKIKLYFGKLALQLASRFALMDKNALWDQWIFIYGNYRRAGVSHADAGRETTEYCLEWYKRKLDENWFERFGV